MGLEDELTCGVCGLQQECRRRSSALRSHERSGEQSCCDYKDKSECGIQSNKPFLPWVMIPSHEAEGLAFFQWSSPGSERRR